MLLINSYYDFIVVTLVCSLTWATGHLEKMSCFCKALKLFSATFSRNGKKWVLSKIFSRIWKCLYDFHVKGKGLFRFSPTHTAPFTFFVGFHPSTILYCTAFYLRRIRYIVVLATINSQKVHGNKHILFLWLKQKLLKIILDPCLNIFLAPLISFTFLAASTHRYHSEWLCNLPIPIQYIL